jgi:hypothetical protein
MPETAMKLPLSDPPFPVHDYRDALHNAVSWLGDRHLLAVPITARPRNHPLPVFLMRPESSLPPAIT